MECIQYTLIRTAYGVSVHVWLFFGKYAPGTVHARTAPRTVGSLGGRTSGGSGALFIYLRFFQINI